MQLDANHLAKVELLIIQFVLKVITVQQQQRLVKLFHVHQVLSMMLKVKDL
jgi:hypothetical protein